jgi:hypothetical protein
MSGFAMFSAGTDCWSVTGVVDADEAAVFRTALFRTAVSRCRELPGFAARGALVEPAP